MAKNKKSGSKKQSNNKGGADLARQAAASSASAKKQSQNNQGGKKQGIFSYIKGVRQELSKVVWPTRQELISYTVVVIATCAMFAIGFWLLDMGILEILKQLLGITLS